MKVYPKPAQFDGHKFELRYGLSAIQGDFYDDGEGFLHVLKTLSDDPPIFEPPDPPRPTIISQIDALPGAVSIALKDVLKRLANGR